MIMNTRYYNSLGILVCLFVTDIPPSMAGESLVFSSGPEKVLLIELFTSQGCSSCPPADKWLNRFTSHPGLWTDLIPIAFHVDYWDNLGWEDPYAEPLHSARQYQYRRDGLVATVYTPGFVVDGKEWRGWFKGAKLPTEKPSAGILTANLQTQTARVRYEGAKKPLDLHLAILGFGLKTKILRGENRNKTLTQDFVVLRHLAQSSDTGTWTLPLPNPEQKTKRYAVVFWVTSQGKTQPLQATAGWLPENWFR